MNPVLMIAFHYPPCAGSSGVLRTLKFSKYLPQFGWEPIILTAHPRAYPIVRDDQLGDIPEEAAVHRALAFDAARHLAFKGAYCSLTALPDRWVSWWPGAVMSGWQLIRRHQPAVIWSTYPIATAHLVGLTLHQLTGLPWIADFRDSMTEDNYPPDPLTRRCYRWIEERVVRHSSRLVFTAKSAVNMYLARYPTLDPKKCVVLANGFDENDFAGLSDSPLHGSSGAGRATRLVHAGLLYPEERDPRSFFVALARFRKENRESADSLRIDLRASGFEDYYAAMIKELAIDDLVHLLPSLPYRESLQDCAKADGLLIFQAASCDHQIPAKVYENMRLQKPILALTSEKGDTAEILRATGGATIVRLDDAEAIFEAFGKFLRAVRTQSHSLPDLGLVRTYSRQVQAQQLSHLLSESGFSSSRAQ